MSEISNDPVGLPGQLGKPKTDDERQRARDLAALKGTAVLKGTDDGRGPSASKAVDAGLDPSARKAADDTWRDKKPRDPVRHAQVATQLLSGIFAHQGAQTSVPRAVAAAVAAADALQAALDEKP
jgi:hypothetical protein